MRLLLDTSAYSAMLRGHPEVAARVRGARELWLNPVVIGELLAGFRKGAKTAENERGLSSFLASPRVFVADIDRETADRYAVILGLLRRAGTPVPVNDLWIAATAMQHGFRLVTTDAHFRTVPTLLADIIAVA